MDLRENKGLTPVESGFPIASCTIDLTTGCNLGCDYCFSGGCKDYEVKNLTFEMGKKVIDWLFLKSTHGDERSIDISFWGGEPLLRWDLLKELVLYAEGISKETKMPVTFGGTTNVTFLTPDKFDFMDEHRIRFLLSIDGTQEHHDRHRKFKNGKGSWETVDKNATEILKRWPDSQVRFSYSVENLDEILDDLNYLYNKGFKDIVYSPVSEGDWTEERKQKIVEKWDEIADWYIDKKKHGDKIKLKFLEDACKSLNGMKRGGHAPCGAGRAYVGIDTEGAIRPCHRFHKFDDTRPWYEQETCIGHIDYGILNQPWRERFTKWEAAKELPKSCEGCKAYLMSCSGGCWATNWDINKSLNIVPDQNCVAELATLAQAEKTQAILGQGYINSLIGNVGSDILPPVQGCQCYNRHDNLFGRETVNKGDRYTCLCNMSTYGSRPAPIEKCGCYNVEDSSAGYVQGYFDSSNGHCKNYETNPLYKALGYLRDMEDNLDNLTEGELKKVTEFMDAKASVEAKGEELKVLQDIEKQLKFEE